MIYNSQPSTLQPNTQGEYHHENHHHHHHGHGPNPPIHVNNQIVFPPQPISPQFSYTWRPSDVYNYGPSFRPNNFCNNYFGPSVYDVPCYPPTLPPVCNVPYYGQCFPTNYSCPYYR